MRLLKADEIYARVNQVFYSDKWKGVSILLYKDARVDMSVLDEEFGPTNWQVSYEMIGDSMFCTISVWDAEKKQWISKQSNGVESNMEAEKGRASDALKRSGFLWKIGRELYTAPNILITLDKEGEITSKKDNYGKDKAVCNCSFKVEEIEYDDNRNISYLRLSKTLKKNTEDCFTWGNKSTKRIVIGKNVEAPKPEFSPATAYATILQMVGGDKIVANAELKKAGASSMKDITEEIYHKVVKVLNEKGASDSQG